LVLAWLSSDAAERDRALLKLLEQLGRHVLHFGVEGHQTTTKPTLRLAQSQPDTIPSISGSTLKPGAALPAVASPPAKNSRSMPSTFSRFVIRFGSRPPVAQPGLTA